MFNPIKNKPIAQQKQIADKQRQEQALREQELKKKIENKKELFKRHDEMLKTQLELDAKKQYWLKEEYNKQTKKENDEN